MKINHRNQNQQNQKTNIKHQNQSSNIKSKNQNQTSNKNKQTNKQINNSISDEGITPIIIEPEPFNPLRKLSAF